MTTADFYRTLREGVRSFPAGRRAMASEKQFAERVMLAVTEVNGCALCSQGHTAWALEAGLSEHEVADLLSGAGDEAVPPEHAVGVAFAQHYADTAGRPTRPAWDRVVATYGPRRAESILGWVRMIQVGNAAGIPLSAFRARRQGEPDPRSSVVYELGTTAGNVLVAPVALLHALLDRLLGRPLLTTVEPAQPNSASTSTGPWVSKSVRTAAASSSSRKNSSATRARP